MVFDPSKHSTLCLYHVFPRLTVTFSYKSFRLHLFYSQVEANLNLSLDSLLQGHSMMNECFAGIKINPQRDTTLPYTKI